MTFIYSRKAVFSPETSARMTQVRCRNMSAARKEPEMIAVSFMDVALPSFGSDSVYSKAMAAKKPRLSMVNIFLNTGGHDRTPEVPGEERAGWRLKLRYERPEATLFLPKAVSTVINNRHTESRIKPKSAFILSGACLLPAALPAAE